MGEDPKGIAASSAGGESKRLGTCEAHHVGSSSQEDRSRARSEVGEAKGAAEEGGIELRTREEKMIPPTYKPKKKFMQLAIAEAKRARDRGDYAIGAVITRVVGTREVVIASAGNRVKTSGSSIKHVELETLKYVSSGYGRYLPDFVLYSTHEPCAMCAGACVWSKIGAVVFGVSQEDITAYGRKHGTEEFKWRACLISCKFVLEKGGLHIPVFDHFLRPECRKLFGYRAS
jgi:tRNA(adenine34) deaminase